MTVTTVTLILKEETVIVGMLLFNGQEWSFQTVNEPTTEIMNDIKDGLLLLADKLETDGF